MIQIYNTLSGKKEILKKPAKNKPLKLFVCGPTVYDYAHLGHARTYLAFDIIARYLKFRGFKIFYLQNITDIDDKIINRAKEKNISPFALAKEYEKKYHEDEKKLCIDSVNKYARASEYIPQIINQIKTLIKKGYAYKIEDDGYYFDIAKFSDYGKLSRRTALMAEDAISRIDESVKKRNKGDFCLWKLSSSKAKPAWRTELGLGRPGWHIEDTAITEHFFGPQYDLHGGATELKFPHHESEIAQQEAASGKKPFVKIWMHTGVLFIEGKKMSKSLKNFITIRDFLKNNQPEILRMLILNHYYRSPIDYTDQLRIQTKSSLNTIQDFFDKLQFIKKSKTKNKKSVEKATFGKINIKEYEKMFIDSMDDDFNTPEALATIFELINSAQDKIWHFPKNQINNITDFLIETFKIFGIQLETIKIPLKIRQLAEKREEFRINKQFIPADRLRKKIEQLGYSIEDTPLGPFIKKNL